MAEYALGLIETEGLVGAIAAADAMLKSANIVLVGKEITPCTLVTIKVIGETAAVHAAIEAGAVEAQRVGSLIARHIIPRPSDGIEDLVLLKISALSNKSLINKSNDTDTQIPDKPKKRDKTDQIISRESEENLVTSEEEETIDDNRIEESVQEELYSMPEGLNPELQEYFKQLDAMKVQELRKFARSIEGLSIYGRQISRANKKELMEELLRAKKK